MERVKKLLYPQYNRSNLNIMATIMHYYGVKTEYPSIPELAQVLEGNYSNIVMMVFDGMGMDMLEKNLKKEDFLRKHMLSEVTSVYPCTTTAAMSALYSGLSPNEHGWIGWSLYFREYARCIDTFINRDSFTGESVGKHSAAKRLMPYPFAVDQIEQVTNHKITSHMINPEGIVNHNACASQNVPSVAALCTKVTQLSKGNNQFIFTYWPEPDTTMHRTGCYSIESQKIVMSFNRQIEDMCKNLCDTLVIITADHGLTDIEQTIYINEIPELDECLIMPPFIEPRAASFYVKPDKKQVFKERFLKYFEEDYILLTKEEVFAQGLLGLGTTHPKVKDFIGDYLACATGDKMLGYRTMNLAEDKKFKAHHAGLTENEMRVPLIVVR